MFSHQFLCGDETKRSEKKGPTIYLSWSGPTAVASLEGGGQEQVYQTKTNLVKIAGPYKCFIARPQEGGK